MSVSHLVIVPDDAGSPAEVGDLAQRIHRLQAEAHDLAHEHIARLTRAMAEVSRLAAEVAGGGEAFPVGARELCGRLAEQVALQSDSLNAIVERSLL